MRCYEIEDELEKKINFLKNNDIGKKIEKEICNLVYDLKIYDAEINSRIKEFNSAIDKYKRKGYSNVEEIKDLIGIMIICKDKKQIYNITEEIKNKMKVIRIKDYIKKSKMGYKSIHILVETKNEEIYEIQIKTKEMQIAQIVVHKYIYKNEKLSNFLKIILSPIIFKAVMMFEKSVKIIKNIKKLKKKNYSKKQ